MKKGSISLLIVLVCFISIAGIIRHDVSIEEYQKLANEKQFDCVGFIDKEGKPDGSCVLISPNYALTAAHCIVRRNSSRDVHNSIDTLKVIASYNQQLSESAPFFTFNFKGKKYKGKSISVPPQYILSGHCDIALVELETSVSEVSHVSIYRGFDELYKIGIGVGFGAFAMGNERGSTYINESKLAGENTIDSIGGYLFNGHKTILYTDFDHPDNPAASKFGESKPLPLEYASNGGDSGGGLFVNYNGEWSIVGITSETTRTFEDMDQWGQYGMVSGYTRVSTFADWIDLEMNSN